MSQIEILDDTKEQIDKFHSMGWGSSESIITKDQLKQLLEGKVLGIFNGEYTEILRVIDNDIRNNEIREI